VLPPDIPGDNRIRIPKIGVDASLTVRALAATGCTLGGPNGPDDVAIYDFTGQCSPGAGGLPGKGNVVLLGLRDVSNQPCNKGKIQPPCAAVFYKLTLLVEGDAIQVFWNHQEYDYTVVNRCWIERNTRNPAEFNTTIHETPVETLSMLTGDGAIDPSTGTYTHYLNVARREHLALFLAIVRPAVLSCRGQQ
jgi:hypothetical protein